MYFTILNYNKNVLIVQEKFLYHFICFSTFFQILENIADNLEEIEEEYLVFRDLSKHPNLPTFVGIFLKKGAQPEDDQLWFVMEVIQFLI